MVGVRFRLFWPVVGVTLCLAALCAITAVSLFDQQAAVARVLRENVASRRAGVELEECLTDLIALEKDRVESVSALHDRVLTHLRTIEGVADEPAEQNLFARLNGAFAEYLRRWQGMPPPGDPVHEAALREATQFLEAEVLRPCTEFRVYHDRRLEETTEQHERVLRRVAWGMAGIGVFGGFAGLVFGYGVARGLSLSIRRLQVRIRDAAGKLGPDPPEIVLTGEGDFSRLHEQFDQLAARIERVVQELQAREREVLRAEQLAAVGQLAAGVAHEVRNPLTSIKMLVQAAIEDGDQGLTGEDLRVIEHEVRRVERSLQTFLDFARPPRPERRPVELTGLVRGVLGLVRGRAEKQGVALRFHTPPAGVTLTGDAGQLQQVLVNLVLNALDAMPGGGVLRVAVREAAGRVEVEVADTGPGVPTEIRPKLFQPFVSGKDTGLGLGLVISRRIAEDHGGSITPADRPGGGAAFTVTLPAGRQTQGP
jgi:two-component system sensor histidine kinase HydH